MPLIVPSVPDLSLGAAFATRAVAANSHAHGTFVDAVDHVDVLVGAEGGALLSGVSRSHEPALFNALSEGFGRVGIITKLALRLRQAEPFVRLRYLHFGSLTEGVAEAERLSKLPCCTVEPTISSSGAVGASLSSISPSSLSRHRTGDAAVCAAHDAETVDTWGEGPTERFVDVVGLSATSCVVILG